MKPLQLIPLGINGFLPSFGRQTMSYLVDGPGPAFLLDAGTGASRLLEPEIAQRLEGQDVLDVVLSHYHLDHTAGLTYLNGVWGKDVRIHAPTPPLVDAEPNDAFAKLVAPPIFPMPFDAWPNAVEIVPYSDSFTVAGLEVQARRQKHPGGSAGLRFEDALAYTTDTAADDATIDFASRVGMLLHEVWLDDEEALQFPRMLSGHAAASDVLRIAHEASVSALAPVHFHPKRSASAVDDLVRSMASVARVRVERLEETVPLPLENP